MKKKVKFIGAIIFIIVFVMNITLSVTSTNESQIELKNLEALACYSVEVDGSYVWDCCEPWEPLCLPLQEMWFYGTPNY